METSEQIDDLAAALAAFHSCVSNPENTRTAKIEGETKAGKPFSYSYAYSDLAGITDSTRKQLAENGLSVTQELVVEGDRIGARLRLLHSSGQWIQYDPVMLPAGGSPKDWGAAATYSRRFGVSAALYLASTSDDDSRGAAKGATRGRAARVTQAQLDRIGRDCKRAGVDDDELAKVLTSHYQAGATSELTTSQASDLIHRLDQKATRRQRAVSAGADPVTGELPERQIDDDVPGHGAGDLPWQTGDEP